MQGISVRLHWTDQPYRWHVNDGEEVFAVLDGTVDMHYREAGEEQVATLHAGDVFFASVGCEHVARPRGEARIPVIEREAASEPLRHTTGSADPANSLFRVAPHR